VHTVNEPILQTPKVSNLLFRSASNGGDGVDGDAKFSIIFGFSDPLAQHRYLEYKRDRLLPGVIRTTRLAITFILSIWIGLGIFLAQAIRNYSLLQFALPSLIWFPAIYLWTIHAWERGIFVLNWEHQYVALCIISCAVISISTGQGWAGHNYGAMADYYGNKELANTMLMWILLDNILFFIIVSESGVKFRT
jgi:hypothetical protein